MEMLASWRLETSTVSMALSASSPAAGERNNETNITATRRERSRIFLDNWGGCYYLYVYMTQEPLLQVLTNVL